MAEQVSATLFGGGDPRALSEAAIATLAEEIPFTQTDRAEEYDVIDLAVLAQLAPSKGAARRLLDQGGLSVNGRKLSAGDRTVPLADALLGRHFLLKKGARDFALVRVA